MWPGSAVEVPCEPRGKGRPRASIRRGAKGKGPRCPHCSGALGIHFRPDEKTDELEAFLAVELAKGMPEATLEGLFVVEILAVFSRPGRLYRLADYLGLVPARTRFDVDNVGKLVLDALQRCRMCGKKRGKRREHCQCKWGHWPVLADDRQVGRLVVEHAFAEVLDRRGKRCNEPRLRVSITPHGAVVLG